MTTPTPETLEREKDKLYVTDAELIRRLGVPKNIAWAAIAELDAKHQQTGFPQKSELWGDRRYWPKVKAWLDQYEGLIMPADAARSAAENRDRTRLPRRPFAEVRRRASP